MNIAYFLIPKINVAYLYDDFTFRQGLEKMRRYGYTAIPVINRKGAYVGTVREGDFLWKIIAEEGEEVVTMRDLEELQVSDIIKRGTYPSVPAYASVDELVSSATNQNFVPVVDDLNSFIGIVTRKDIIKHFTNATKN